MNVQKITDMEQTNTATQTAQSLQINANSNGVLNLQALQNYLQRGTDAATLADELDELIFEYTFLYGESRYEVEKSAFATTIYRLQTLRNAFLLTAIENGETLNFERIKNDYLFLKGGEQ